MKRYIPEIELQLYFLYTCRRQVEKLLKLKPPAQIAEKANASLARHFKLLKDEAALTPDMVEEALRERWMEFEGHELRSSKLHRCLTHKATVQARIKAGIPMANPKTFGCQLSTDCMECDCFRESTEDQQYNFDVGLDVFTGADIPELNADLDEED